MTWRRIPDFEGKVFIPDRKPSGEDSPGKHPCRDCFACQNCSDDRCSVCRPRKLADSDNDSRSSS